MNKINYKLLYIFSYVAAVLIILFSISYVFSTNKSLDVNKISVENFKDKLDEKENYLYSFIDEYKYALNALASDETIQNYNENKTSVQNLFLTFQKALPDATQIRIIDNKGLEKIKVSTINENNKKANIRVVPDLQLQDKSTRYYFNDFMDLKQGEIGLSKIDLEKEYGKTIIPNIISLRVATPIYDKNNNKSILIINVTLNRFFDLLGKATLYNLYLVDSNGRFVLHSNSNKGLKTNNFDIYTLTNEFGSKFAKHILDRYEFYGKNFYSRKLSNINSNQDIIMVLSLKFEDLMKEKKDSEITIFTILIVLAIIFLPLIVYLANIPEILKNKINKQNITDDITMLPNRQHLFNDLNRSLYKDSLIVLLNIDNFTKIQNGYGYKIADKLIKELSDFLQQNKLENDYIKVYRISKNMFALKYIHLEKESLYMSLEKLHYKIEHTYFNILDDFNTLIDITIGVSDPNKIKNNVDELKEAEIALDYALESKIDINIYNESDIVNIEVNKQNIITVNNIKKAIEEDGVVVYFQPIYNNYQNKIEKYETLIRLNVGDKLIFPDTFIPIAKDIKKYRKLTEIIITKSFKYFKDKNYEFSINLSIEDILDKNLRKFLIEQIKEYEVNEKLVIEIVESEAIDNYNNFLFFIKEIKDLGCKIAIDDFGSGYSNYEHIINLSEYIDYLKIDGSLINNIDKNPKAHLMVGTIKFLCDQLNIRTIAEYIENEEIFDYVKSMGINYSQGYYIGKPAEEIVKEELNLEKKIIE